MTHLGTKLLIAGAAFLGAAVLTPAQAATNSAPTISGSPAPTTVAGQMYSFQPTARDADGNFMFFSVTSKPAWARLDWRTGRFYGTPTVSQTGSYEEIEITVTDGRARSKLQKFSITVLPDAKLGNAPTISGAPLTSATVGKSYSFKPTAFDMDGNVLTFSLTGRPAWATLNKQTGELAGTPTAAQVGVYPNVQIAVTDGTTQVQMAGFSITVNPAAVVTTKSVSLSWTPPTRNTDGSALTNLSGYRIVYGTQAGTYTQSVSLNTVGLTSYTIDSLNAGKYYFAMISRASDGTESSPSAEISVDLM